MRRTSSLTEADYRLIAQFRFLLRRFLSFSEAAARATGLMPQQHQALLAIRGGGGTLATGELSDWLAIRVHSAAELAGRLEAAGLIRRDPDPADRRRMLLRLTPKGTRLLETLTLAHRDELAGMAPLLAELTQHFQK